MSDDLKPPKRTPSRHSHLERLLGDYSKAHGVAPDRMRRWISTMTLIGALDRVRDEQEPRFLVKGGVSIELRLGLGARSTQDVDFVFRGPTNELLDALQAAFERPYSGFEFRRKGEPEEIRDTGSKRLAFAVSFQGRGWQTLTAEIGRPEADESDLVSSAISLWRVREACVRTFEVRGTHDWPPTLKVPDAWSEPYRFDVSQIGGDLPDDVQAAAAEVVDFIAAIDLARPDTDHE